MLAPREGAILIVVCLSLAALILMIVAITFPFLRIEASGLSSRASVFDAILAFSGDSRVMAPLSFIVGALIVLLPTARLASLIYVLGPLLVRRRPLPHSRRLFRAAMRLRPWAMAEIFMIGVAVALVKVVGLARVEFGPAFWAFAGVVVLVAAKDNVLCERSIWQILTPAPRS